MTSFMTEHQKTIIGAILAERKRQDEKWGEGNYPLEFWTGILGEEYGEFCEAVNETVFDNGTDKGGYENMKSRMAKTRIDWRPIPNFS